jgi:hypothetical protein
MPVVPCGYGFFESQVSLVNGFVNTTEPSACPEAGQTTARLVAPRAGRTLTAICRQGSHCCQVIVEDLMVPMCFKCWPDVYDHTEFCFLIGTPPDCWCQPSHRGPQRLLSNITQAYLRCS